jgi:hypothetical protein
MSPKQFLELLAASLPDPSTSTRSRLLALAPRIEADVPPQHLTREVVDAIAPTLPRFPRLDEILKIRSCPIIPASSPDGASAPDARGTIGHWLRFLAAAESQPIGQCRGIIHRLSVVRAYGGDAWPQAAKIYRDTIARYRPDWLPEAEAEREKDRARRASARRPTTVLQAAPPPHGPQSPLTAGAMAPQGRPAVRPAPISPESLALFAVEPAIGKSSAREIGRQGRVRPAGAHEAIRLIRLGKVLMRSRPTGRHASRTAPSAVGKGALPAGQSCPGRPCHHGEQPCPARGQRRPKSRRGAIRPHEGRD